MNYEIIQGLGAEIACHLKNDSLFKNLILYENMEQEIDIYSEEEGISYGDLAYETTQALACDGYTVVDAIEYAIKIGRDIAEEIYATSEVPIISIAKVKNKVEDYDYPQEIDKEDIIKETINKLEDLGYTITDSDELVTPFPYHCTPYAIIGPFDKDKYKNIKGLELEISDNNYKIEKVLKNLATKHIIETSDTFSNSTELPNIALEEDNSVKYELIFRAQTNDKLMEELEKIKELETYVENKTGTSAHIHMNRAYIEEELGLTEMDITKAAEFLSYPLFLISGRKKQTAHEWARSTLPCPIEVNLAEKAKHVDKLKKICYAKHSFLNCGKEDTIELRIFSNKCNVNKNVIKMYLETVDFIIELAKYMKNRSYIKELQNIIPLIINHFEEFGEILNFFGTKKLIMDEFKEPKTLIKTAIKNEWITIDNEISRFMHYTRTTLRTYETIRKFISMIKTLNKEYECNYDFNINPETTDIQKLAGEIRRDIRKTYEIKMEVVNFE
jgi:hypothetical protein